MKSFLYLVLIMSYSLFLFGLYGSTVKEIEKFGENIFVPFTREQNFQLKVELKTFDLVLSKTKPLKNFGSGILEFRQGAWNVAKKIDQKSDFYFVSEQIHFIKKIIVGKGISNFIENLEVIKSNGVDNFQVYHFKGLKNNISSYQFVILNDLKLQVIEKKPIGTISTFYIYEFKNRKKYLKRIIQNRYEGIQRVKFEIDISYKNYGFGDKPHQIVSKASHSIADNSKQNFGREIKEIFNLSYVLMD